MSVLLDAEGEKPILYPIWLLWLDVEDDPIYAFTGVGTISFAEGETGDPALDGKTFTGLGQIAMIGDIQESENGSGATRITVPGVDPALPGFKQFVADRRAWQFRRAILWHTYATADATGLVDYPQREKTGRMDGLEVRRDGDMRVISINIEGFAASGMYPTGTKYAEQPEIDPSDISMSYIGDLVNKQPELGPGATQSVTKPGSGGGGSGKPDTNETWNVRRDAY